MAHAAYNFDTWSFVKRLKEAGCNEKLAEAHAKEQTEILTMLIENQLITKDDIKHVEKSVKHVEGSVHQLEIEVIKVQHEMRESFAHHTQLFKELDMKIDRIADGFNTRLGKEISDLNHRMDALSMQLTIRLGGMMVVVLGFFHALNHFI